MWTSSPALVVWHPRMEAVGNDQLMPSCPSELHIPTAQSFPNLAWSITWTYVSSFSQNPKTISKYIQSIQS